jgi:hypothetical protein
MAEIPGEFGLVEAGVATADEWKGLIRLGFSFDPDRGGSGGRNSGGAILWGAELSPRRTANGSSWTRREQCQASCPENAQRKLHHRISVQTNSTPAQIR